MGHSVVSIGTQFPVWPEGVSDHFLSYRWSLRSGVKISGYRMGSNEGKPGDRVSEQMKHGETHGIIS